MILQSLSKLAVKFLGSCSTSWTVTSAFEHWLRWNPEALFMVVFEVYPVTILFWRSLWAWSKILGSPDDLEFLGDWTPVQAYLTGDSNFISNFSTVAPLFEKRFGVVQPYKAFIFLREPGFAVPARANSVADRPFRFSRDSLLLLMLMAMWEKASVCLSDVRLLPMLDS